MLSSIIICVIPFPTHILLWFHSILSVVPSMPVFYILLQFMLLCVAQIFFIMNTCIFRM